MGKKHAEAYTAIPEVQIISVIDSRPEAAKELARNLSCLYSTTIQDLDPLNVDIIDICLPTFLHAAAIEQATKVCRNIICEKPLAFKPEELATIRSLVSSSSIRLMTAHVIRFKAAYQLAHKLVCDGLVGRVNSITCFRRQKKPDWIVGNWLVDDNLSGGLAYDLAIHDIDFIAWMLGKPCMVFACTATDENGIAVHLKTELVYNGCVASVFSSWGMPAGYHNGQLNASFEFIGDKGRLYSRNGENLIFCDDKNIIEIPVAPNDAYRDELKYFIDCCREDREPILANLAAISDALDIAQAVNQSIAERHVIYINHTFT